MTQTIFTTLEAVPIPTGPCRIGTMKYDLEDITLDILYKDTRPALFSREDQQGVQECLILMEPTRFSFPMNNRYPLFFLFAEEREAHQKQTGCSNQMIQAGHQVNYYKGSTHISFMDHGYICPPRLFNPNEYYFNGTLEERKAFFDKIRKDIRSFLGKHLQAPSKGSL